MQNNIYHHKVQYYECDRMGITHHSNYVRFMEEARIAMLERLGQGLDSMEMDGIVSPVVDIALKYRKPTTFPDIIDIEVSITRLSAYKLRLGYTMTVRGEVVCLAESSHCFLDGSTPVALEERYPALYSQFKEAMEAGKPGR